jgi:hypothetical protein
MTARAKKKTKTSTSSKKSASKHASATSADGASKSSDSPGTEKATAGSVSSLAVNLGHIFALWPRVETSFKPGNLETAKHFFRDDSYATIEEAARAVAEKALELTREGSGGKSSKRKRH